MQVKRERILSVTFFYPNGSKKITRMTEECIRNAQMSCVGIDAFLKTLLKTLAHDNGSSSYSYKILE